MSKQRPQKKTSPASATGSGSDANNVKKQSKSGEIKPTEMKDILNSLREPWIQKRSAMITMTVVSVALMALVAWNLIKGSGNWGQGLLWGFIFGGSVWLVFFGMTWFHSLFNKKKK